MGLTPAVKKYLTDNRPRMIDEIVTLGKIPAPSNHEEKRAQWCKEYLESFGAEGVYIDSALNVVYPYHAEGCDELVAFLGHTDVVFPDTDELPVRIEGDTIYGPGIGDDTANAVAVMEMARMVTEMNLTPKTGILFVLNTGEEGLGNLKGVCQVMEDYKGRVSRLFAIDGNYRKVVNDAVGSKRYRIELKTEGGHSYGDFGNRNAIYYMSQMISTFYAMKVPDLGKTTYNVGLIQGGTSVNTIAQSCEMYYEYRSDKREALEIMDRLFENCIATYRSMGVEVDVELVGNRPCKGDVDNSHLVELVRSAAKEHGLEMTTCSGSTDCNIPLSQGVPAVCFGVYLGEGAHTRGEHISISSLDVGMEIFAQVVLSHFE